MSDFEVTREQAAIDPFMIQLVEGDSLAMETRVRSILRERALIWDVRGLVRRSLAILGHRQIELGRIRRSEGLVLEALEEALEELLDGDGDGDGFEVLGLAHGCSGGLLRRACWAHNQQPLRERRAFQGLVLEQRGLDEVAKDLEWDGGRVARAARRVLVKFFQETVTPEQGQDGLACVPESELLQMEVLR